jgi:hypothetical protein
MEEIMGVRDLLAGAKIDLRRLLSAWRTIVFSRQTDEYSVQDRWHPGSPGAKLAFWAWSILGVVLIGVVYPFAALGFWTRYVGRQIDRIVAGLGVLVIIAAMAVLWGGLTALAWDRLPTTGFRAVLAASVVATASVGLSWVFARYGSRRLTLVFAYPFAVAAIFVPPVTAALFSPAIGAGLLSESELFAEWLLNNVVIGGLSTTIRQQFELAGLAFIGMWFGFAVPVGWALALLVSLANLIRPRTRRNPQQ